jgi:class 3 adenylate cyclase
MELATLFLRDKEIFGVVMSGNAYSNVLVAIFILAFVLCAGFLTIAFIRKEDFDVSFGFGGSASDAQPEAAAGAEARSQSETRPATVGKRRTAARGAVSDSPGAIETAPQTLSPEGRTQRAVALKFLGDALGHGGTLKKAADAYGKFGTNLFMAGACEGLARSKNLDVRTTSVILSDAVRTLGVKKHLADAFADKRDEYLLTDARYLQMYNAGRGAMNSVLEGDPSGVGTLEAALDEWNQPKPTEKRSGTVTVMFTDMVGSTNLTQTKGDAAAQQVVRLHNRIVRDALGKFAGNEIKHTGDGIMASFDQSSRGVSAAIFIQRETAVHSTADPNLPLKLKIGINAGEPIAEDDDLFGSTVQLAARIVDKASAGQIFVSEAVHGICAGKEYRFASRGRFETKGIAEPVTLHEVVWDEGAATSRPAEAEDDAQAPAYEDGPAAQAPVDEPSDGVDEIGGAPTKGPERGPAETAGSEDAPAAPAPVDEPNDGSDEIADAPTESPEQGPAETPGDPGTTIADSRTTDSGAEPTGTEGEVAGVTEEAGAAEEPSEPQLPRKPQGGAGSTDG